MMDMQSFARKPSRPQPALIPRKLSSVAQSSGLPHYIKPIPTRLGNDETTFLEKKGALAIPPEPLRNALLKSYAEFVHPYMPLLNLHEIVEIIDQNSGTESISLLLFQATMFSGVATVEMRFLRAAGYSSRKDARRQFFQKVRLLYDFDYELDRIALIQALLLMTYWYETPDDQKDSHHWMGIAVSLAYTIGLNHNPEKSTSLDGDRQKLWKRIWWCTYMRDRLIALGMRRPTKIKPADFDVPMLSLDDFEIETLPESKFSCIPIDCKVMRDTDTQRRLAILTIESAKLCIVMSHVLSVQYSVLHNNHGLLGEEGTTRTTMMLVQKRGDAEYNEVEDCDRELQQWRDDLADEAQYIVPTKHELNAGDESLVLNRSLLHMIYYATLSALHRPQVLPSTAVPQRTTSTEIIDISRKTVRLAAAEITNIALNLYELKLVPCLPTTGITVLLPAIVIHLLDIKANDEATRRASLKGFCECMQVMTQLRDIYAAADFSTAFLEAAVRKAEITLPYHLGEMKDPQNVITSSQGLVDLGRRMHLVGSAIPLGALTPPPEDPQFPVFDEHLTDAEIRSRLHTYLASTPPESEYYHSGESTDMNEGFDMEPEIEPDFDSLIDLDAGGEAWACEDSSHEAMGGGDDLTLVMDLVNDIEDVAVPANAAIPVATA